MSQHQVTKDYNIFAEDECINRAALDAVLALQLYLQCMAPPVAVSRTVSCPLYIIA